MNNEKIITIKDVASLAGVSISSVSRYLKDPSSVKSFAAYQIKDAINELEYVPNTYAQSLRSGTTKMIGIVVPNLEFFFGKACRAISDYFYNQGYVTFICESDNDALKEKFLIEQLINQRVAGIIVASSGHNTLFLKQIMQKNNNFVMLDRAEDVGCDIVAENHEENSYQLTKFALENNVCDCVELLLGDEMAVNTRLCVSGASRALKEKKVADEKVKIYYGCRREDRLTEAVNDIKEDINLGRPMVLGFEPDFIEQLVINLNRIDNMLIYKLDIAGFVMRNTIDKIGMHFPCIVQNPEYAGITAAEVLYKRINGKDTVETPRSYEVKSIYKLTK